MTGKKLTINGPCSALREQKTIEDYFKEAKNKSCEPAPSTRKPVLVLDLDETLVHCADKPIPGAEHQFLLGGYTVYVKLRPYLFEFLNTARECCNVILFTASEKSYADKVIALFDDPKSSYFSYFLLLFTVLI